MRTGSATEPAPAADELRPENLTQLQAELTRARALIQEQARTITQLQAELAGRPPAPAVNADAPRPPVPSR